MYLCFNSENMQLFINLEYDFYAIYLTRLQWLMAVGATELAVIRALCPLLPAR